MAKKKEEGLSMASTKNLGSKGPACAVKSKGSEANKQKSQPATSTSHVE